MVSNFMESHSPVLFSLVCTLFPSKNVCKKLSGDFCGTNNRRLRDALLISLFGENKRFLSLLVQQQIAESAAKVFACIFTQKRSTNQGKKKYRAVTSY